MRVGANRRRRLLGDDKRPHPQGVRRIRKAAEPLTAAQFTVKRKGRFGRQVAPLEPLAANTGIPERDPSENSGFSVGRGKKPGTGIDLLPRELELRFLCR